MRTIVLASIMIFGRTAVADDHHGFTAAIDVGGGATRIASPDVGPSATELGPGWNLTVGAFVRPDLAIGVHTVTQWAPFDNELAKSGASIAGGVIAQYWPASFLAVHGGAGFGILAYRRKDPQNLMQVFDQGASGFAPMTGAALYPFGDRGPRVAVDVVPIIGAGVIASASIGWQYVR
jgi:hypothetical protein